LLDIKYRFRKDESSVQGRLPLPRLSALIQKVDAAALSDVGMQKLFVSYLTVLPLCIRLSVASPRALSQAQASLVGPEIAGIHQAVRKGDILLGKRKEGIVGVKVGSKNKTPIMVIQGMLKSFLLDGLLRLDGASLTFAGITLEGYTATLQQIGTSLFAHYLACMRQNLPALVGSMAAFGNPLGLVRGLGEGVGDFVLEPARGLQRSVQEMDASHLVDGVARGTLSLARHTVGGFADSAAMLAETFSKNMTVLTLDRRYALKRDHGAHLRTQDDINVALGIGSGAQKLARGFLDGVSGVVKAPLRGAEKRGLEGFAKGVGKGLLGLLVKPIIGISDGFTDVMIGVKGTLDGASGQSSQVSQIRPGRALYGRERAVRPYSLADAAAATLMLRTRLAGEHYLSHMDMGNKLALISVKRLIILGRQGQELLVLKLKHIASVKTRNVGGELTINWGVIVLLNTPRQNGSEVEVILCHEELQAVELAKKLEEGRVVAAFDTV
jgi:Vacuolar-sorting-associated 13 protein C-terminal/Autophagy-related protein C terminal domain